MPREKIKARGHPNVTAKHASTWEITRKDYLTKKGDCIIGILADKALPDLSEEFKDKLKEGSQVEITLRCDGVVDRVLAEGHPNLTFAHPQDMVVRKSNFICDRTLAVKADKSAGELKRELIEKLKQGKELTIELKFPLDSLR